MENFRGRFSMAAGHVRGGYAHTDGFWRKWCAFRPNMTHLQPLSGSVIHKVVLEYVALTGRDARGWRVSVGRALPGLSGPSGFASPWARRRRASLESVLHESVAPRLFGVTRTPRYTLRVL